MHRVLHPSPPAYRMMPKLLGWHSVLCPLTSASSPAAPTHANHILCTHFTVVLIHSVSYLCVFWPGCVLTWSVLCSLSPMAVSIPDFKPVWSPPSPPSQLFLWLLCDHDPLYIPQLQTGRWGPREWDSAQFSSQSWGTTVLYSVKRGFWNSKWILSLSG